ARARTGRLASWVISGSRFQREFTVIERASFFSMIFGECVGLIEVRPLPPLPGQEARFFRTPEDAEGYVASLDGHANIHFGAATRGRESGTKADVHEVPAVWADCDKPESVLRLEGFPLRPTAVIETSPGRRQAFWRFESPVLVEGDGTIATIEAILKGIAEQLGADPACAEIARILRVPGTLNVKRNAPCRLLFSDGPRYRPDDFISRTICQWGKPPMSIVRGPKREQLPIVRVPQGLRNTTLVSIAGGLRRNGMEESAINATLQKVNEVGLEPPLAEAEVRKISASISRYESGPGLTNGNTIVKKPSQAEILIGLAGGTELFHDQDGKPYATFKIDG